jgi:hypothetical protein
LESAKEWFLTSTWASLWGLYKYLSSTYVRYKSRKPRSEWPQILTLHAVLDAISEWTYEEPPADADCQTKVQWLTVRIDATSKAYAFGMQFKDYYPEPNNDYAGSLMRDYAGSILTIASRASKEVRAKRRQLLAQQAEEEAAKKPKQLGLFD